MIRVPCCCGHADEQGQSLIELFFWHIMILSWKTLPASPSGVPSVVNFHMSTSRFFVLARSHWAVGNVIFSSWQEVIFWLAQQFRFQPGTMALLLRAVKQQLLGGKAAPWMQQSSNVLSRAFSAQAEPLEEEEGMYVVTGVSVYVSSCKTLLAACWTSRSLNCGCNNPVNACSSTCTSWHSPSPCRRPAMQLQLRTHRSRVNTADQHKLHRTSLRNVYVVQVDQTAVPHAAWLQA